MRDLIERKEEIIRNHQERLSKQNQDILSLITKTLQDKKTKGEAKIGLQKILNLLANVTHETSTGMESKDKLELAKMYFQNAENMMETFSQDPHYASFAKDFDIMIKDYQSELQEIENEYKQAETEDERARLRERREGVRMKR